MYVYLHLYVCVSACPCTAREHYICTYVEEKLGQVGLICKHEMLLPLQVRTKLAPIQHWLILFHQPIAISQRLGL
jgi:hypothetical protein